MVRWYNPLETTKSTGGTMKVLPIEKCNECKNCQWHNKRKLYFCILTDCNIERLARINSDCPLIDYKPEEL